MPLQSIVDFIKTLYSDKPVIALYEPSFFGNEKKYVAECIDSTFVSSVGPFVGRFEEAVANYVSHAVAHPLLHKEGVGGGTSSVSNGPAASLRTASGGPGDNAVQTGRGPRLRGDDTATEVKAVACVNGTAALHLALVVSKLGDVEEAYVTGDFAVGKNGKTVDILLIGTDIHKDFLYKLIDKAESLIKRKIRYLILSPAEAIAHLGDGKGAMLIWRKEC
ncbi:MAG: hypothetical protein D4R64_15535 [Porphyromonadaceae bacterium]|nr:MAG: hypothetical protein D4R64_15535 [Porphyromonadaceae bacterium]